MFNLRYHVASLVAVFLSLAVGLLLGTVVQERGMLDKQRTFIADSLRKDFEEIRTENKKMSRAEDFAKDAGAALIAGSLEGKTVLVMANSGRVEGLEAIREAVDQAGGRVAVATFREQGGGISGVLGDGSLFPTPPAGADGGVEAAARVLAAEWVSTTDRPVTESLISEGLLSLEGLAANDGVEAAAFMVSWDGKPDMPLMAVLEALQARGVYVSGAETTVRETGVAAEAAARGLSAVDHVDTPQGKTSLVWLLTGKAKGYFGDSAGTDGEYPKLAR